MVMGDGSIVSDSDFVDVRSPASIIWTVKLKEPVSVGMPRIKPLLLRVIPAGRAPFIMDQVYGVVPPVAVKVWLKGARVKAFERGELVVMVGIDDAMIMENDLDWVKPRASVTSALNWKVPEAFGMPEIWPLGLRVSPFGSAPVGLVHDKGAKPSVASRVPR